MSDDLLIRLLQLQHRNGVTLDAVEQLFESADLLHLDILSVVLDALGARSRRATATTLLRP